MKDLRKNPDRRGSGKQQERTGTNDRRTSPDRRLNDIQVEWIPFSNVQQHPQTHQAFSRKRNSD